MSYSLVMTSQSIQQNLQDVRERIDRACSRVGRSPDDVTIVAVTKTHGPDVVDAVVAAGIEDVGENRVQEFLAKANDVTRPCRWHLIGTLQSNKAVKAIGRFTMVHSIDRPKIAQALSRLGVEHDVETRVLIEVRTTNEPTKHGFAADEVPDVAAMIAELPALRLEGLMTLGPLTDDMTAIRRAFQTLFRLKEKLEGSLDRPLPHLSMGMSDDFEIAVEEGSTMVRLGRVLLGSRRV